MACRRRAASTYFTIINTTIYMDTRSNIILPQYVYFIRLRYFHLWIELSGRFYNQQAPSVSVGDRPVIDRILRTQYITMIRFKYCRPYQSGQLQRSPFKHLLQSRNRVIIIAVSWTLLSGYKQFTVIIPMFIRRAHDDLRFPYCSASFCEGQHRFQIFIT